jgi:hypothetical protein
MARHTLETLPRELMISILECVCQLIVKKLTTLTFTRRVPYGRILNQVTHLELASDLFHTLLTKYVKVDGMPVRQRLLELQMQKFTNYIESVGVLPGRRRGQPSRWSEVAEIQKTCGNVWMNTYFRNIIPQLLNEESKLTSEAVIFLIFQLPKLFEAQLVKTADDSKRNLTVAFENLNLEEKEIHDKSVKTEDAPGNSPRFDNLVHNRRYRFETGEGIWSTFGIEFEVGRQKFPFVLPVYTKRARSSGLQGEWIGTSILSSKNTKRGGSLDERSYEEKNIMNGEEGRYWLWFVPNESYILMDYEKSIAMNVYQWRFDIGRYGKRLQNQFAHY